MSKKMFRASRRNPNGRVTYTLQVNARAASIAFNVAAKKIREMALAADKATATADKIKMGLSKDG